MQNTTLKNNSFLTIKIEANIVTEFILSLTSFLVTLRLLVISLIYKQNLRPIPIIFFFAKFSLKWK